MSGIFYVIEAVGINGPASPPFLARVTEFDLAFREVLTAARYLLMGRAADELMIEPIDFSWLTMRAWVRVEGETIGHVLVRRAIHEGA